MHDSKETWRSVNKHLRDEPCKRWPCSIATAALSWTSEFDALGLLAALRSKQTSRRRMGNSASRIGSGIAKSTSPMTLSFAENKTVRARLNVPRNEDPTANFECESPFNLELKTKTNGTAPSRQMVYIDRGSWLRDLSVEHEGQGSSEAPT